MTSVAPLPAIALVFADAAISANTSVFAALAGALSIATFLTLATTLTARLTRQVLLIGTQLMLEIDGSGRSLTRLRGERCWRHWWLCRTIGLALAFRERSRFATFDGLAGHGGTSFDAARDVMMVVVLIRHDVVALSLERAIPIILVVVAILACVIATHWLNHLRHVV